MAISFDCPVDGGLTAPGAYVRIGPATIKKNREDGTYYLTADLEVYVSAAEAAKEQPERLASRHVDRFKMDNFDPSTDTLATTYAFLKQWVVDNSSVTTVNALTDITDV